MKYTLPTLTYDYNALEPFIDEQTMRIHHTKHHQAYIDKLNSVMEKYPQYENEQFESLMKKAEDLEMTETDKVLFRNHGGGHLNHSFFWSIMGPKKKIDEALSQRIIKQWSSVDIFKKEFENTAISRFGSGWAWLVEDEKKVLHLYSTTNQDSPLLQGHTPLIGLDVWEHAYYLKYQNRRAEYITNWWNVVKII
jgi:Fe-Mn family superoxide dismutase